MLAWLTVHKLQLNNIMAILSKGTTYSSGNAVTAANLNGLVDSATFVTGSNQTTDDSTLEVHSSGYLKIKDGGVDTTQLAAGAVDSTKLDASFEVTAGQIADNAITLAKMEHGTAGDLLSYNTSAEPVRVSLGAASTYLRVNAAANGVEWSTVSPTSKYSSGWVTTDGSTSVANGASLSFTHNLGTEDFVISVYARNIGGTLSQRVYVTTISTTAYGAVVEDMASSTVTIQLANGGLGQWSSSGVPSAANWNTQEIKIVAVG